MIIISEEYGQLSNRLYALAPFIAYALRTNTKLMVLSFGRYQKHYPAINTERDITFVPFPRYLLKMQRYSQFNISRVLKGKALTFRFFDTASRAHLTARQLKHGINFIDPWMHPKPWISAAESRRIIEILRPSCHIRKEVNSWLEHQMRTSHGGNAKPPVLAVHARRGDYK